MHSLVAPLSSGCTDRVDTARSHARARRPTRKPAWKPALPICWEVLSEGGRIEEFQPEVVAGCGLGLFDNAGGQLEHGVGAQGARDAPGAHIAPRLYDAMMPIKIDKINREPHRECVHGFAGHDPQALAVEQ